MTREDIIRMAREAGLEVVNFTSTIASIERFAELVAAAERNRVWTQKHWTEYERSIVAAEREECANIAREVGTNTLPEDFALDKCYEIEAAIRARGGHMNERIRELAERTGLLHKQIGPSVETRHMKKKEQDLEQFAQLIVRECARVQHERFCKEGDVSYDLLMQHFGSLNPLAIGASDQTAAAEREACAKQLDVLGNDHCAAAIRARGGE